MWLASSISVNFAMMVVHEDRFPEQPNLAADLHMTLNVLVRLVLVVIMTYDTLRKRSCKSKIKLIEVSI